LPGNIFFPLPKGCLVNALARQVENLQLARLPGKPSEQDAPRFLLQVKIIKLRARRPVE
jgi:hypothetical protein